MLRSDSVAIIEDEPGVLFVLTYALRQAGLEVHGFTDPRAGWRWLASEAGHAAAVLLVDLWMPGLGGREIVERLAAAPKARDLAIYLMTGATTAVADALPDRTAYRRCIAKPFDLDDVVATVVGALSAIRPRPVDAS